MDSKPTLSSSSFYDLLVIGGGVYGLCAAWDASLRGLKVALVEKDDFAHACTAANYKLIHGGLRYLQHLDIKRMRVSIRERRTLSRIAPHLIKPMSFVIPCYGHGIQGPEAMRAAFSINDLIGMDRNKEVLSHLQIPKCEILSPRECLERVPGYSPTGLTGAGVYTDLQMQSPERLAISMGFAAAEQGAVLANYTEVTGFVRGKDRILAAKLFDHRTREEFEVQASYFMNMTGPWSEITRALVSEDHPKPYVVRSKGVQLFTRKLSDYGFSVQTRQTDKAAKISRGKRSLFVQPWRNTSFIGQSDTIYRGDPDDFSITPEDVESFLEEINDAYPAAELTHRDVVHVLGGMIPVSQDDPNSDVTNVTHHYDIHDHASSDGMSNVVSVNGVKYTIARYLAEKAVDLIYHKMGKPSPVCQTSSTTLPGGDLEDVSAASLSLQQGQGLSKEVADRLITLYGSQAMERCGGDTPKEPSHSLGLLPGSKEVLESEIRYVVKHELVEHVEDVILRRSDMGSLGHPGKTCVRSVARIMSEELGWNESRVQEEVLSFEQKHPPKD